MSCVCVMLLSPIKEPLLGVSLSIFFEEEHDKHTKCIAASSLLPTSVVKLPGSSFLLLFWNVKHPPAFRRDPSVKWWWLLWELKQKTRVWWINFPFAKKEKQNSVLPRNRVLYCTRHPAGGGGVGGVCGLVRDVFPTELCGSFSFRLPRTFGCSSSSCRCVSVLHYETCSTWLVFLFSVFLIFADRKWAVRGPRTFLTFHSHWALGVCVCVYSILECPFFIFPKWNKTDKLI